MTKVFYDSALVHLRAVILPWMHYALMTAPPSAPPARSLNLPTTPQWSDSSRRRDGTQGGGPEAARVLPAQLTAQHQQNQVSDHKDEVDVSMNIATQQRWFGTGPAETVLLEVVMEEKLLVAPPSRVLCFAAVRSASCLVAGRKAPQKTEELPRKSSVAHVPPWKISLALGRARKITADTSHLAPVLKM